MTAKSNARRAEQAPTDLYMGLIRRFALRPIRSDEDHDRAVAVMDALIDRESLEPEEQDYMEVLGDLIEAYEDEREPAPEASPVEILRDLLEANGLSQAKFAAEVGMAESTISDILSGRRPISRKALHLFAERFRVDPSLFI